MLDLKPLDRNFTSTTATWQSDPFIGLLPTAVNWSFCKLNDCIGLKGGLIEHVCEMLYEFPHVSPQGQKETESQVFSRSLSLIKSGYHKDINGKGRKRFDELLLFPDFHFGSFFVRVMFLGQYAKQGWLNLYNLILTLSRNYYFGINRSYRDDTDKTMAELY